MTRSLHFLKVFVFLGIFGSVAFMFTGIATADDTLSPSGASTTLPEQLFDIRLTLENPEVASVRDLSSRVEFVSFGRVPTPVDFHFTITDVEGRQAYASRVETVVVETELQYPKRFLDAQQLPAGKYVLHVETTYKGNTTDTFSQPFTVIETSESNTLYIVLAILGIGTLVWIGYFVAHLHNKIPQERMIAVTTRTAALVFAGVVLPTAAQLVNLQMTAENRAQASLGDSITLRASTDVAGFIAYTEKVREDFVSFADVAKGALSDEQVIAQSAETLTIDAVHIVNLDGTAQASVFRELGFASGPARAFPNVAEGLYRRADGVWHTVATYPRAEGGWYRIEASVNDLMQNIARSMRPKEETFLLDDAGIVLVGSEHYRVGENFFEKSPGVAASIRASEYSEGVTKNGNFFTARRVFVPKGQGAQRLHLVSEGAYGYRSDATVHFAF